LPEKKKKLFKANVQYVYRAKHACLPQNAYTTVHFRCTCSL